MKKVLKRIKKEELYHFVDGERIAGNCSGLEGNCSGLEGNCSGLRGDCSGLRGDCSGLEGNCSGLEGNCSGLRGNCSDSDLTSLEREAGIGISLLVQEDEEKQSPRRPWGARRLTADSRRKAYIEGGGA
ncbi:hypothetical protein LJC59_00100 [Desulfovibrio sp. OttesenSCG-928-A18]|nr:hypothetical protein [Desulfovibrio sp. OttesenSCG-928-A18]